MKIYATHRLIAAAKPQILTKAHWTVPNLMSLRDEYDYEYMLASRGWKSRCRAIGAVYPVFDSFEDFVAKVKQGRIGPMKLSVENTTHLETIDEIKELVSEYQWPRDVNRIVQGFKEGVKMPMPIVIRGRKGSWILSGNTRSNVAEVLGLEVFAIYIDA